MAIKMIAPPGVTGVVGGNAVNYTIAADRTISVANVTDALALLAVGWTLSGTNTEKTSIIAPLPADLISIVAAVTPSNVALTLAAQPVHARKLQCRLVLGTPGTTNILTGTATIVGTTIDGDVVSEVIQMPTTATVTVKSQYAYAAVTSITVANYTAAASGTGNTIGFGVSNDFAVPTLQGLPYISTDFALIKATKITNVLGTSIIAADDVAATATLDVLARTIAPTTAPAANGLVWYDFTYNWVGVA